MKKEYVFVAAYYGEREDVFQKSHLSDCERRRIFDNVEKAKTECFTDESPMIEYFK